MSIRAKQTSPTVTAVSNQLDETSAENRLVPAVENWHSAYDKAIDRVLRDSFQDVLDEPVPERFIALLDRLVARAK